MGRVSSLPGAHRAKASREAEFADAPLTDPAPDAAPKLPYDAYIDAQLERGSRAAGQPLTGEGSQILVADLSTEHRADVVDTIKNPHYGIAPDASVKEEFFKEQDVGSWMPGTIEDISKAESAVGAQMSAAYDRLQAGQATIEDLQTLTLGASGAAADVALGKYPQDGTAPGLRHPRSLAHALLAEHEKKNPDDPLFGAPRGDTDGIADQIVTGAHERLAHPGPDDVVARHVAPKIEAFAKAPPEEIAAAQVEGVPKSLGQLEEYIDGIQNPDPTKPLIVNFSFNGSPANSSKSAAGLLELSPDWKAATANDPDATRKYRETFEQTLIDGLAKSPEYAQAKADLTATVERKLVEDNILIIKSAGNAGAESRVPGASTSFDEDTGILSVGASFLGDDLLPGEDGTPDDPIAFADDVIAPFSSDGADIAAPGGYALPDGTLRQGTSFSAPLVAGMAAVLSEANPSLGAEDLRRILTDPRVLSDLPGDRDGGGQIDLEKAVDLARSWMPAAQFRDAAEDVRLAFAAARMSTP